MDFSEYDATWPGEAQRLIDQLRIALSAVLLDIEHIGSTSVPELAAKPIIDVMGSVRRLEDLDGYDEALAGLGITPQETDMTGRLLYCRRGDDRIDVNLHIVTADTWDDRNERILRDHLRGNPAHVRLRRPEAAVGRRDRRRRRLRAGEDRAGAGDGGRRPRCTRIAPGQGLGRLTKATYSHRQVTLGQ